MKRLLALVAVIAVGTLCLPLLFVQGQEQAQTGGIRRVAKPIPGQYIVVLKDDAVSPGEKPDPNRDQNKDQDQENGVEALVADLGRMSGGVKHVYTSALKCGASVTSRSVKLSLTPAPVFITQPADAEVCVGYQASFTASANGDVARYEWYKDGVLLGGGTVLHVVTAPSSEGLYHAVAIDKCGRRVESRKAKLSLGGPVTITQQPVSMTARAGQSVTFSVAATGGNLRYKWRKNGANILGAASESSSFTIPSVSAADAGAYSVVVYNACGPAKESAAATLTVLSAVPTNDSRFIIQNAPVTMVAGGRYNVSVTFRNTGASTWTAANGYKLVSQAPLNNTTWGLNEVPFPSSVTSVAPGADVTFSFTVTAPATPGRYRFDWRVTQGTAGFGSFTPGLEISVTQ